MEYIERKETSTQDVEATEKKVVEKNITLGIDDINNDIKKILPKKYLNKKNLDDNDKKVLAVILHACRTKCHSELGFYPIPNRTLRNISKVGSSSLTAITNKLKMLGLIDFEQGETRKKGKASQATRYTILFDDKLVKKSTYFDDTEQEFNDSNVDYTKLYYETQSKINDTQSEVIDTEQDCDKKFNDNQSSCIDTSVDNQGVTEKESKKSGVVNVNLNRNMDSNLNLNMDSNLNLNMDIDLNSDMDRDMDLDVNRDMDLDVNRDMDLDVNKKNNTLMKELIKNIIISINHNTRVNLENYTKLIESINSNFNELTSSILSLKNGKETDSSIELYKKEIEERDNIINKLQVEKSKLQEKNNKLQEDYSKLIEERANSKNVNENGKSDGEVKTPSIQDKILSYSLEMATKHPTKDKSWKQEQQEKALQEARQTSKVDTKVTVVENNSNDGERNYVLKKLECEIIKPFKSSIVNANSYEKLMKTQEDFNKVLKKYYNTHQDVITISDIKPFSNELRTVFQQKEEELTSNVDTNEPSSNGDGIVQSEDNNTKDSEQKPSKDETVEATDVETSPKEDETDNTRFQHNDKTYADSESCQEKETATAEPNAVESKKVQVSETDTPNSEEKSKEQIVEEFEKETSTMFLIDDSKNTVQAKKVEEVQFPKTEKIVLSSEEQKQFQELVNNQSINAVIKKYTVERNFEEILTEIRNAVTRCKYQEIVVQAYIDYAWNTYTFDCNVQDAMKPIEITNEDTVTTTASTQKGDSFEEFLKDKVDNIRKNSEENGSELPFGKNPKSRYQDDDESNCYQSEEEKAAMSSSSSYDESQDEMF